MESVHVEHLICTSSPFQCMCVHACVHMNVEIGEHLRRLSSGAIHLGAGPASPRYLSVCFCPQSSDDKCHSARYFLTGLGDLNSGSFACKGSVLSPELSSLTLTCS